MQHLRHPDALFASIRLFIVEHANSQTVHAVVTKHLGELEHCVGLMLARSRE